MLQRGIILEVLSKLCSISATWGPHHRNALHVVIFSYGSTRCPFQPVSIRVSSDPISLIEKVLAQNPGSYVRLHDLVSIGTNFILAGLTLASRDDRSSKEPLPSEIETAKKKAERRVIGMAIEASPQRG